MELLTCIRQGTRCEVHGGTWSAWFDRCQTAGVLGEVAAHRAEQFARYGTNDDLHDGTGPEVAWLRSVYAVAENGDLVDASKLVAEEIEAALRRAYEKHESKFGKPTWRHLVLEEVAEAFVEDEPGRLREELLQVAALAVSWIESIDARA